MLLDVSGVAITLLGGFAASVEGRQVPAQAWRLKKGRELVKLLALAPGHRLHREQAMDALWRDRTPASAANNLYQAVHTARRALGADAIEVRDEWLRLDAEVDVDGFERAAATARRARTARAYRAALSLYGGELLAENLYDDWVAERREELGRLRASLASELAALEPDVKLGGLPVEASSFVGRERELTELNALLTRTRLLTLAGAGGAGKTRLALEFARRVEDSYAGGVALVELDSVSDPPLLADAIAGALDVRALPGQPVADAVADFLASRESLLVLDSCEHVLGATAAIADTLLRRAPPLTILATTREPLRVAGEVVFRVPSLAIPDPEQPLTPEELGRYESVRLFVERTTAAVPAFELVGENAASVARICFRLDGLPLALELAAGRLGALGASSIAERLDQRFTLLRSGSGARPTRQQTLEATLQWSHDLLEPDERVLFRRLAVFAGDFDLAAVEAVCAGEGLGRAETVDTLARLVEKSLVTVDDRSRERRYRLLETVRLYAGERLAEAGESDVLAMRHARWALALAEATRGSAELDRDAANLRAALDTLAARDAQEALRLCVGLWPFWLRRIDLAEAHRRLIDALAAAPMPSALRVEALHAAAAVDVRSGLLACAREHAREALSVAVELDDRHVEWRALQFLGTSVGATRPDEAELWFGRAHELAQRERLAAEEALGVYSLGVARWLLGDVDAAEELVGRSVELFRALAPTGGTIPSPTNILNETLVMDSSAPSPPRLVFEATRQPFVTIGIDAATGFALLNLARVARTRGDFDRARSLLDESDAWFARIGEEHGRAEVVAGRAYLELAVGSLPEARACLVEAGELHRRTGDRRGLGLVLIGLGQLETAAGDDVGAARHLAEAEELFRRAGDRWGLTVVLWRRAELVSARGDLDAAQAALDEALRVSAPTEHDRWIAITLAALADLAARRNDDERAEQLVAAACERFAAEGEVAAAARRALDDWLRRRSKGSQRSRKGRPATTSPNRSTTGGRR